MEDTMAPTAVDTRDMIVVHTAMLREVRLAPAAVMRAASSGSARMRTRTARHLRFVLGMLEHHHAGEDRLLLPLLRDRVPAESMAAVNTGEKQHAGIEGLIADIGSALDRWTGGDTDAASGLVDKLTALHTDLETHLRGEEDNVLPLAATHLSVAEWEAIGEAGFAATPKSALLTAFGMFMYSGDPEVLELMLAPAPPPVRILVPRIAPLAYARRCRTVHGTARP